MDDSLAPALFIDSAGNVVPVAPDEAQGASQLGWLPASPKQAADYAAQQKYGGAIEGVKAFGEHAAGALTFGLSDVAERASGLSTPEAMAGRERANPTASTAGTIVGVAGPLLATLGASAPVSGAAAAAEFAAPSLIARAGQATTAAVRAALPQAEGIAGKIAARALAAGAGSAIEGAAYGAGQVVHEAALGDPNLTAQSALATIGISAALGGGLGAVFGATEAAVPEAVAKAKDAIGGLYKKSEGALKDYFGKSAETTGVVGDTATLMLEHKQQIAGFERLSPGVTEDIAAATPETAAFLLKNQTAIAAAEKGFPGLTKLLANASPETGEFILTNWQKIIRDPSERIKLATTQAASTQEAYNAVEKALRTANREIRPAEIGELLANADPALASNEATRLAADLQDAAAEMKAAPELYPSMYPAKVKQIAEGLQREVREASSPAEIFNAINDAKQNLDPLAKFGKLTGPEHRDATSMIKGLRGAVKESLEDSAIWGEAAARQQAFNSAQNEYFTAIKDFRKTFTKQMSTKTGAVEYQIDPVKVNMWFNAMADARGQMRTQVYDRFTEASKNLLGEIEKSHAGAPVVSYDRKAIESLVNKSADITADARQRATVTQLVKQLQPGTQILGSGPAVPGAAAATGVLGMIAPGFVTSSVKATVNAAKAATNVPRAVATLAALERMGQSVSNKIDAGVISILRGGSKAGAVGRAEAAAGIAASFGKDADAATSTYLRRTSQIRALSQDPASLAGKLTAQTDDLHEHAPQTAQSMQIATARAVAFLASKLPQTGAAGPLAPKYTPSRAEISKFSRYYEAVNNPTSLLKQAAAGTVTAESLEAVKTVYPELFAKMQSAIVEKLAGAGHKTIPHAQRMMLAMLLGQDLDGTTSAAAIQRNRAVFQRPASAAGAAATASPHGAAAAKALTLANRFQTPDQRSAARGK